jgi:hypothetical protein
VPPPRANLTRFHGVFAPGAKLRPFLRTLTEAEPKEKEASAPPEAAAKAEAKKERMPRLDWAGLLRRTFVLDVFACAGCGGRRRVLAYVTAPSGVRAIVEHLGLPSRPAKRAPAQGPPQQAWC